MYALANSKYLLNYQNENNDWEINKQIYCQLSVNQSAQRALGSSGHKKKRAREGSVSPSRAPVLSFAQCQPLIRFLLYSGFSSLIPFFYPVYLTILLVHRELRDEASNRRKYGASWDEYCRRVPYRILPKVFQSVPFHQHFSLKASMFITAERYLYLVGSSNGYFDPIFARRPETI